MTKNLQPHFYDILQTCSISNMQADKHWQTLAIQYNEPHRHYHNLTHIKAMLGYFERYKLLLKNPNSVALAIYYHDVIYDATIIDNKQSNEQQSAEFFQDVFKNVLDKKLLDRVVQLIMLTEGHKLSDSGDNDAKLFLDMDLSILGQHWAVYQIYSNNIRQEYTHVPEDDYRQGRKAVLEKFLQRTRLYFSDEFYQQYEEQARTNVQREIALLASKSSV